jgi:signal transduction histidine kinase
MNDRDDSRGNVLVVDDTPANLALACSILRNAGFDPRPTTSGPEALAGVAADPPDLILLDISMPGMDGYETCRRLKSEARTADIPVIFLTAAQIGPEDSVRGFQAGAVDYITKPVIDGLLVARVDTHVRLRRGMVEIAAKNNSLAEAVETRDRFMHLLGHDLRNSFSGIPDAAELLAAGWRTAEPLWVQEILDNIVETGRRCFTLLQNTLTWARAESNQNPVAAEEVQPREALVEAAASIVEPAHRKELEVIVGTEGGMGVVTTDPFALTTILRNLAGNACKYSPRGGKVALKAHSASGGVEFSVEDSGPGFDPAQAAGLGGGFVRSQSGTEAERGSGIGLVICGSLARKLGTSIVIGRSPLGGARVFFIIPTIASATHPPGILPSNIL